MMRILALAAIVTLAPQVAGAQDAVAPGGFAAISAGGAELMRDGKAVEELPENTWFEVIRSSGAWTAGYAWSGGERKSGWVLREKLAPESIERQGEAAAAWEERGAKVERDAQGAVLAIDASESRAGDQELAGVGAFPRLEELTLGGSQTTDAGLAHLASLPRLRRLFLDELAITDQGLEAIGKLRGLEVLSLADTPVTDKGAAHLSTLTELQVLNLSRTGVTDVALFHLAPLTKMETLALRKTKVEGPGLAHLRGMERLNVVNLSECPIDGEHLLHFAGMEHLRILHVADCNIDPDYIERLEDETPSLAVFD